VVDAMKSKPFLLLPARRFPGEDAGPRATYRGHAWALAGVMAAFRPRKKSGARSGAGQFHLGYSPYVLPSMYQGFKCVIVDRRLHDVEPLAHNFVLNFALDNRLRTEALD